MRARSLPALLRRNHLPLSLTESSVFAAPLLVAQPPAALAMTPAVPPEVRPESVGAESKKSEEALVQLLECAAAATDAFTQAISSPPLSVRGTVATGGATGEYRATRRSTHSCAHSSSLCEI